MNREKGDLPRRPIIVAIAFFAIAAILGLSMRMAFVIDMPEWFQYRNIQHAHSHVALLGWLFAIYFIIIIRVFELDWSKYSKLYWSLQGCALAMLFTFPILGYTTPSIAFSILHILLIYSFVYKVWKAVSPNKHGSFPVLFLRASLFFLALSTVGTLALGPIIAAGLKGSAIYYASIQFYLHFQFNGWFVFSVLAIFFSLLKPLLLEAECRTVRQLFWTLLIGTVLTYALAITWSNPNFFIFTINSIGILVQFLALILFLKLIFYKKVHFKSPLNAYAYKIASVAFVAFLSKIIIQTIVVFPVMAEVSYTIRNFVVGFIHLLMLGGLSLFAFSMIANVLKRPLSNRGTLLFIFGVLSSELLLFGQGLMQWQEWGFLPYYYLMIAVASTFILLGILFILFDQFRIHETIMSDSR